MNKVRIIGLIILALGIIIKFTLENDIALFLSWFFFAIGLGLIIAGKIIKPNKKKSE
jgi:uncharacterized protein YjeT (DUF2065 family)